MTIGGGGGYRSRVRSGNNARSTFVVCLFTIQALKQTKDLKR